MKTKILTSLLTATLLSTSILVSADQKHGHDNTSSQQTMSPSMMGKSGNMGMMMSGDMQAHMTKMQADMMAIQNETDPAQRKALMDNHFKDMKSMMGMMKKRREMMQSQQMNQMVQFDKRLSMMEAMMEQVVNSQIVTQGAKVPISKK